MGGWQGLSSLFVNWMRADFRVREADDPASLLVLILEVSASSWAQLTGLPSEQAVVEGAAALEAVVEQLLVFLNTYLLLHDANRCCIILASPDGARLVYPAFSDPDLVSQGHDPVSEDALLDATAGRNAVIRHAERAFSELRDAFVDGVKNCLRAQDGESACAPSPISTAFAKALCLQNRVRRIKAERTVVNKGHSGVFDSSSAGQCNGRILAVLAGHDVPEQYVPVMNCIFSAQRMGVPVDSCVLARGKDSTYFQQAAYLTSGVYLRPEEFSSSRPDGLIQILQTVFLVDKQSRDFLAMPTPDRVDFRASCMETREIIQDGYTCSVCLSTFAASAVGKGTALCPVCSARFAVMPRAGRRPPKPGM